ncbi:RHS repeat-associated core domain-containing protein [Nonomuraea sp. NPDC050556]|uniref:RHS repeat-associated core domain-containing protein n=1 Tax=Nonomuraea sp. NPDC050556 TaxID=3364369 RepID=UPI00378F9C91
MRTTTTLVVVASLVSGLLVPAPASATARKFKPRPIQKTASVPGGRVAADRPAPAAESDLKGWKAAPATYRPTLRTTAPVEYGKGLVFAVRPTSAGKVPVSLDTSAFGAAYGGDWAQRLTLVSLPACALTTPDEPACRTASPLATTREGGTLNAEVSGATVIGVQAAPKGAAGTYKATTLSPSGQWTAGSSSGGFTYEYPIDLPDVPGSLQPSVSLGYNSSSVDGRTASTNNQPSWIGEGWDYEPGFIERAYEGCKDSGELCWKSDNATLSLGDSSTALVRDDATGVWKPERDDGSRVQWVADHWVVTKKDGTQYWFGANRLPGWTPGRLETQSVYTVPVKDKGVLPWRWQLDYVVDPHGNAMAYYYDKETNSYTAGGSTKAYVRAGVLKRIEYGLRHSDVYATPLAKVEFRTEERCLTDCATFDAAHAGNWPDVPFDQNCAVATCPQAGPTFWTRKRLTEIATFRGDKPVDTWALAQDFPDPGDGTARGLWLSQIVRTAGGQALKPTTFHGKPMENRVDADEGRPPLNKYRITRIGSDSGSDTLVTYADKDCTYAAVPDPAANTRRCYPAFWTPADAVKPLKDWFHKYVVKEVTEDDKVAGSGSESIVTAYEYGNPGWAKDDSEFTKDENRTYSVFRGFQKVRTWTGVTNRTQSDTVYLRGMGGTVTDSEGNSFADDPALSGQVLEKLTYSGDNGSLAEATVTEPWLSKATATRLRTGTTALTARMTGTAVTRTRTLVTVDGGTGWRRTRADRAFDDLGQLVSVSDQGDTMVTGDETCATTTYTDRDLNNWLVGYEAAGRTTEGLCAAPGKVTGETRTLYDGQAFKAAPRYGEAFATRTETLDHDSVYAATTTGYDAYGRITRAGDELGRTTTTAYTPATGLPTGTVTTDAKGFTTTTAFEPVRGQVASAADANGRTAVSEYDAFGRLAQVWLPGRARTQTPNLTFGYAISAETPVVVTSRQLLDNGSYRTTTTLLDGLLRERQVQQDSRDGKGRVINDIFYDTHGRAWKTNAPFWNELPVAPELFGAGDELIPAQTVNEYDGLGRTTEQISLSLNVEQRRTSNRYGGNYTATIPPEGDSASMKLTDAAGHVTQLRQYTDRNPAFTGRPYDATAYTYDVEGQLRRVADAAGNVWAYDYDLRGHKIASTEPDTGAATFGYDAAGQAVSTKDARGITLVTDYDELGRRTAVKKDGVKLAGWTYDTLPLGKGLPASSTRYDRGNAYVSEPTGYTAAGQPTGTKVTIPSVEGPLAGIYTVGQGYTGGVGLPQTTVYEAAAGLPAETVTATYDARDQLVSTVNELGAVYVGAVAYSPFGEVLQSVLGRAGKQIFQTTTYENDTRRVHQVITDRSKGVPTTIGNVTYDYTRTGDIKQVRTLRDDEAVNDTQCYTYDHRRRLKEAWASGADCTATPVVGGPAPYRQSFTYDAAGNRRSETLDGQTRAYTYAATGHTVRTAGTDSFEYDEAGNTKRRKTALGDQTLTWDAQGKLAESSVGGVGTTFLYDADGNRLMRRDPKAATLYLGTQELTNTGGVLSGRRFYQGPDGVAVRTSGSTTVSYVLADRNGTGEVAVNGYTMAYTRRDTTPFGTARGAQPASWPSQKGFVGGTVDDTTGLTHVGAREYDVANGRFISADPIMDLSDPQQINGYAYASNNPVTWSDPSGLKVNSLYDGGDAGAPPSNASHCVTYSCAREYSDPEYAAQQSAIAKLQTENAKLKEQARWEAEQKRLQAEKSKKKGWWDKWGKSTMGFVGKSLMALGGIVATAACGVSIVCGIVVGAALGIAGYAMSQASVDEDMTVSGVLLAGAGGAMGGFGSRVYQGSRDAFKEAITVPVSLEKGGHTTLHKFKDAYREAVGGVRFLRRYEWQWNANPARWLKNNRFDRSMLKKPYDW